MPGGPGAVTGVVERLERAGLAYRAPDPAGRSPSNERDAIAYPRGWSMGSGRAAARLGCNVTT
jgi:hypothetical protein